GSAGAPSCISTAISVAATDNGDLVASFSNLAAYTTLFAPGVDVYAAVPGGGFDDKSGTSMAAPHVAGVIAALKQARPTLTVPQITSALTSSGPFVSDQRAGGTVAKRRLQSYEALCRVISCDADDFRVIQYGQTLSGAIAPGGDVDHYYFIGQAGDRLTLRANRTSGNLDPYLELLDRTGSRVALNDNGGGGVNALINGYTLQRNDLYVVRVLAGPGLVTTGGYQLTASRETVPLNPAPGITRLSPASATATAFGADFWVAVHGSGFMPQSTVRWNGALRSMFYSSSALIYIRVRGSDIGLIPLPPRLAFITVQNPTPGGGASNAFPFNVTVPFLGESELVAPPAGSGVAAGLRQTFVISWTHPDDSWRTMQRMDMRLRSPETGAVAAVVRVIERDGETSTMRLLSGAEAVGVDGAAPDPIEGLPGEARELTLPGVVTLHLAESAFSGSGRTAIMSPTLSFDPAVVGSYNIEFEVDSPDGAIQADDVLGTFHVLPAGCLAAVSEVTIGGPASGTVGGTSSFSAAVTPGGATGPISYTWSPAPTSGQGTPSATYTWGAAGEQVVSAQAENCGGFAAGAQSVAVSSGPAPDLAVGLEAPALALAGEPVTYTLTVTNSGATGVSNLRLSAAIPAGATYQSGGSRAGDSVSWDVGALGGAGATVAVSYTVTAQAPLSASVYGASADGGHGASAGPAVATQIVDALTGVSPVAPASLAHGAGATGISVELPAGTVFADTEVAYRALAAPSRPLPPGAAFLGRAFALTAAQGGAPAPGLVFGDTVTIRLGYAGGDPDRRAGLVYWDGARWSERGISCAPGGGGQELVCAASGLPAGELALLALPWRSYLPLTVR
ncbi:MAG TPA: S8 family serine peptidase, partial [Chloroflexaceae bacterium]|nr:S8 family serine peptidase [Chloroflexaceae bacterium]